MNGASYSLQLENRARSLMQPENYGSQMVKGKLKLLSLLLNSFGLAVMRMQTVLLAGAGAVQRLGQNRTYGTQ
jgi:hypothetical protein